MRRVADLLHYVRGLLDDQAARDRLREAPEAVLAADVDHHREPRAEPPMPYEVAQGGGEPVPTAPPGGRWLHPIVPDDDD